MCIVRDGGCGCVIIKELTVYKPSWVTCMVILLIAIVPIDNLMQKSQTIKNICEIPELNTWLVILSRLTILYPCGLNAPEMADR